MEKLTREQKLSLPYPVKSNFADYKEIDEDGRTVKTVVNTYNYFDHDYDVLRLGAAKKSIQQRGYLSESPDKILHALFHDLTRLPGKSKNEKETEVNGNFVLYTESFLPETTDGEDTLQKYLAGIYNQHSIGFQYLQLEYIEKDGDGWNNFLKNLINPEDAEDVGFGYDVKEIKWYEWSTVAFGANKLTPYLGVKGTNKKVHLQNIFTKMEALVHKAKRLDIKNKKIFELQYKQLKQMILELTTMKPDNKELLVQEPSPSIPRVDYEYLINKL